MVMLLMLLDPANPQRSDPFDVFSTAPHTFSPFSIGVPDNAFAVLRDKADVLIPPDGVLQMPAWRIAD